MRRAGGRVRRWEVGNETKKKDAASPVFRPGSVAFLYAAWRKGRDLNPRMPHGINGFQDRRIKPLCHPSVQT